MIKFENLDIYNWHNAIRGMRNSFGSWDKMDSYYVESVCSCDECKRHTFGGKKWVMGPNDMKLAMKLSKAGDSHAKFLRQILVSVDIIAGNEWWKEFDTYKVGTVANSTSLMHTLGKRLLTPEDFSFDDPTHPAVQETIERLNNLIRYWWQEENAQIGSPTWRLLQKLIPMGFVYRRTVTMNYQVLKRIYHDRKGHRLKEWREFCAWVKTLPYSQLITLEEA